MAENMVTTTSWNRDNLIAGQLSPITERITVASGQNIVRGTLLGKITRAVSTVVPGTNTGNGTISAFTMGKKTAIGSYVVECISNVGTFKVLTPSKERLDDAVAGTAYASDHVNFTIADGSVDFVVGDKFTLTVIAGSGYRVKSLLASVDGSEVPESIAVASVDASLASKTSNAYVYGQFNQASVTFGTGHTFANTRDALRKTGIFLTEVSTQN